MEFKDRLKELRASRNLTQDDFSKQSGIGRSVIGMYETGRRKPSFEVLERIADFFNVTMDYLTGKSDTPQPSYNVASDDDVAVMIGAYHRKLKEKHANNPNKEEYFEDLKLANTFISHIFGEKARTGKLPPITTKDEAEQLLLIRYRILGPKQQNEIAKRLDELCTLYSAGVDTSKFKTISAIFDTERIITKSDNEKNTATSPDGNSEEG